MRTMMLVLLLATFLLPISALSQTGGKYNEYLDCQLHGLQGRPHLPEGVPRGGIRRPSGA